MDRQIYTSDIDPTGILVGLPHLVSNLDHHHYFFAVKRPSGTGPTTLGDVLNNHGYQPLMIIQSCTS